jgi:hypothetical protein
MAAVIIRDKAPARTGATLKLIIGWILLSFFIDMNRFERAHLRSFELTGDRAMTI